MDVIHLHFTIGLNGDMPAMKKMAGIDKNPDYSSGAGIDKLDCIQNHVVMNLDIKRMKCKSILESTYSVPYTLAIAGLKGPCSCNIF